MRLNPRLLLFPFSLIYGFVTSLRNWLFDRGIFSSTSYQIPLISVGNLTVGGTGKTPLTEYLVRLLAPNYQCALLSRGYRRKTKGPILADNSATPDTIGDEPLQLKQKFPDLIVAVAEKRNLGMQKLLALPNEPAVVLLDDAFQHRSITPGFSILVTDFHRPVYKDFCLPAGNLREPLRGKDRANIMVVNKCPEDLTTKAKSEILRKINPKPYQQVFFSTIVYQKPQKLISGAEESFPNQDREKDIPVLAVAGIGNPAPFFKEATKYSDTVKNLAFGDHHHFTESDIRKIANLAGHLGRDTIILTTEKDAVRLREINMDSEISKKIWYIPIQLKILFNQENTFNKTVQNYVSTNQ